MSKVFVFILTVLAAISVYADETPAKPEQLAGTYSRGQAEFGSWTLRLEMSGEYSYTCRGCVGVLGSATGTWQLSGHSIELVPAKESGKIRHLRQLHLVRKNGAFVFVSDLNDDYFRHYGADEFIAFHRKEIEEPAH